MLKFLHRWTDQIRSSLWFIPGLLVLSSVALALIMVAVDSLLDSDTLDEMPFLFGAGADGAREMLGAVAMSMATIAGVTFSITIVALGQASNQYSPRILGNFMSDRANQVVLGVFLGIFAYSLVVLRSVRGEDEVKFIPSLSVVLAVILALVGMGFLIFFIHHLTELLRVSNLVGRVRDETETAVDRLFPSRLGEAADEESWDRATELLERNQWIPLPALRSGYIQSIDNQALLDLATEEDLLIRMDRGIGEFVVERAALASVVAPHEAPERLTRKLNSVYVIRSARTVHQDVAFGIRELVDVALKGLSPSINETTTAIACIDQLTAVLSRLAARRLVEPVRMADEQPRVIARGPTFTSLLDEAFVEIRRYAENNVSVLERMCTAIETIAAFTSNPARRAELRRHVGLIAEAARRGVEEEGALTRIEMRATELQARLVGPEAAD